MNGVHRHQLDSHVVLIDHEWGQKVGAPGREDLDEQTVSRFDEEDARRLRDALIALGRELGWPEGGAT